MISVEKKLLAMGRAYRIVECGLAPRPDGGYTYHDYTINGGCSCPEYRRNEYMYAAEVEGKKVAPYPGILCKHLLAAQVVDGVLAPLTIIEGLSPEAKELVRAGYKHQRKLEYQQRHQA